MKKTFTILHTNDMHSSFIGMEYDATTFGNHEFDLGPEGLGKSISIAAKSCRIPTILSSNTNIE